MNSGFWKGKKVLITGHTGFKGSWLSLWLQNWKSDLIGYSKSILTKPSLFELANIESKMTSIMGDISDLSHLKNILHDHKPEIIIHMAAQSLVRQSYLDPLETFTTNVIGTANLLEAVRKVDSVKAAVIVTSDKCYENKGFERLYKEDDPMGGYDPYSSSKGCAELVTSSFRNSFFNPEKYENHKVAIASTRAGNVIGGGDWSKDRLVPDIMSGILEHRKIKIRKPNAIRPWQHVLEPLSGYLLLVEKLWHEGPKYTEAWNFGPPNEDVKPVSWIVENIVQRCNHKEGWESGVEGQPYESDYLRLDSSKAKTRLGWKPKLSLDLTLEWTIRWYKEYEHKKNMREFTESQINEFILI